MGEEKQDLFRRNVRMRLAVLGWTMADAAREIGVNPANFRGWLARGTPSARTLERIGKALGVNGWALLNADFDPREGIE